MALKLGKSFNRCYYLRVPILDGFYNIGVFFDKRSTFLLFRIDPDFGTSKFKHNVKISMFKNLESSKFCETFIELHSYGKNTLDIVNQFDKIKDVYTHDISFVFNETLTLSKVEVGEKTFFDTLNIYGLTINSYSSEFLFLIAERHNVLSRLNKKIVRTSALQIATSPVLQLIEEYCNEAKEHELLEQNQMVSSDKIIKFSDVERDSTHGKDST